MKRLIAGLVSSLALLVAAPSALAWEPSFYPVDSGGGYGWVGPLYDGCQYRLGISGGRTGIFYNQYTGEFKLLYCDYPLPPP
jgi:hypothetical protein